jgi:hypothetical protein
MDKEREIAREAVHRIRSFSTDRPNCSGEENLLRLSVKFCGGCNPHMDRGAVLEIIRSELLGQVRWVSWGEETDLLLLLNGCPVSCTDRPEVRETSRRILKISGDLVSGIEEGTGASSSRGAAFAKGCLSICPER